MLSNHREIINLGEVSKLKAYINEDRELYNPQHPLKCLCGKTVYECDFWNNLDYNLDIKKIKFDLDEFKSFSYLFKNFFLQKFFHKICVKLVKRYPFVLDNRFLYKCLRCKSIVKNNYNLFSKIAQKHDARFIVDSSKDIYRYKMFDKYDSKRILLIHLYRDPKGVVWSNLKRNKKFRNVIRNWYRNEKRINNLEKKLPYEAYLNVCYERLCEFPQEELNRICNFLGIDYDKNMESLSSTDKHHIGGTPNKFNFDKNFISLDKEYEGKLTKLQMSKIAKKEKNIQNRYKNI
jgi:hypothetical protein